MPVIIHYGIIRAMHRWQRAFPLFLLTLLALPALQPLFTTDFTCGFDNNFHLWRAVQMGELLREGVLFSRWAPHMAYGYGYPLFLFQSPFSAYLAAGLNLLGFSWATAVNSIYALSLIGSGWAMWLLGRELWGDKGGLVAAVAYMFAPFHAYVLFYRASLSESVAWIFPPLILWGLRRWQLRREGKGLVTAVFSLILLVFTHDASAYAFMPLFVGWIVANGDWGLAEVKRSNLLSGIAALTLGFLGSAFFWLPTFLERSHIQFGRAISSWPFRYFDNFLPLDLLLAWPRNADPALLNDWPERALGVLLLTTAVLGFFVGLRIAKQRLTVLFLGLALLGYTFLTIAPSQFIWDNISLLQAFQFPWRFLAPASMAAALLSGALAANWLSNQQVKMGLTITAITLLSLGHWGWFYPDHCPVPSDTTTVGLTDYERATDTIGTTAKQELLPTTVKQLMPPVEQTPIWQTRLNPASLPDGVHLFQTNYSPLHDVIELETPTDFTLTYPVFYFPGWQVQVDGNPIAVAASEPEGWLQFTVPNGRHTLTVQFTETSSWLLADWLSLVAVVVTGVWAIRGGAKEPGSQGAGEPGNRGVLLGLAVVLLLGKGLLVDQQMMWPRWEKGVAGERPSSLTFGNPNDPAQIRLLGYEAIPDSIAADEPLPLTLFWQASQPTDKDYRVGLTLVDANGLRWSEDGLRDYRWARNPAKTPFWPPDKYVQTAYLLDALSGTPPGEYTLRLSLFDRQTLAPLTIFSETGQALGPWVELGEIALTAPNRPWTDRAMPNDLEACITIPCLVGSSVDRTEAVPGDEVLLTLFWLGAGGDIDLILVDSEGTAAAQWPITLPTYPPSLWRDQRRLQLPTILRDGSYQWQIIFADGQRLQWADLHIDVPDRILEPPTVSILVDITLGEQATLWGATIMEETDELVVILTWRGERPIPESYHVFLHLVSVDGSLVAQSDGIPAGNRPTTGWLPGEYISDVRRLPLPSSNDYWLRVGLYLPEGERLKTAVGQDAITVIPHP